MSLFTIEQNLVETYHVLTSTRFQSCVLTGKRILSLVHSNHFDTFEAELHKVGLTNHSKHAWEHASSSIRLNNALSLSTTLFRKYFIMWTVSSPNQYEHL